MYDYGVVEYLQQNREHITAQSPLHKAANQVRADQSLSQKKDVRTCMRHRGCFPGAWSSWHFQVACLHVKCRTIYHIICHSAPFLLVSERRRRIVPQAKHSTAQCNQPCTKQQTKYVPIRARQRKQADRVGESQHVVEHFKQYYC